jgi:transcription antitermination factor NusG
VAFDDKDELHRAILSIDGIINFLGINGKPSMVRPEELTRLRSCEERGDYDETLSRIEQMLVGLSLPIKDGPFETLYATVRSVTDGEAMVDIELLGRATPLKISVDSLVKPI